jgi:hypothetical protein
MTGDRCDAPAGTACPYCEEPVELSEILAHQVHTMADGALIHRECLCRMIVGSVGHQLGRCPCRGGTEDDPPCATLREGARAALKLFRQRMTARN